MGVGYILKGLELAGLSGMRPAAVLLVTAILGALGYVNFPGPLHYLATPVGVGALLILVVIEHLAERDGELLRLLSAVHFGLSAASALVSLRALGAYLQEATPAMRWLLQGGAVTLALATMGLRRAIKQRLLDALPRWNTPAKWLARLEEGSVVAGALLVFVAPFLLLGLMLVGVALSLAAFVASKTWERRYRRKCEHCGTSVRVEAQRCKGCNTPLTPKQLMSPPKALSESIKAGWQRLNEQPEASQTSST